MIDNLFLFKVKWQSRIKGRMEEREWQVSLFVQALSESDDSSLPLKISNFAGSLEVLRRILQWRLKSFLGLKSFLWSVLEKRSWLKNVKFLWSFLRLKFVLCCQFQSYGSFLALENELSKDCQIGGCFAVFFLNSKVNFSSKKIWAAGKIWAATKECVSVVWRRTRSSVICPKRRSTDAALSSHWLKCGPLSANGSPVTSVESIRKW